MKSPLLPTLLAAALLAGPLSSARADDGKLGVPWLDVPAAVRKAVNDGAPAGSSVGKVEKKIVGGKELYDIHLKLNGGVEEQVVEMDALGHKTGAPVVEAAAPEEPEAKPEEAPKAAPPPPPALTGLEGYGEGPAEGNAEEEYKYGQKYEYGTEGERKNYPEAAKWYTKAAGHGSAAAAFSLGGFYADARGVTQDNVVAARWYWKAAQGNNADAQYNLGHFYAAGSGVAQDYAEAYFWFSLAAGNKVVNAPAARTAAAAHLTPEQIASADKEIKAWKPSSNAAPPATLKARAVVGIAPPEDIAAPPVISIPVRSVPAAPAAPPATQIPAPAAAPAAIQVPAPIPAPKSP